MRFLSFSLNPIHRHCGPLNTMSASAPSNAVDKACYKHDMGYSYLSKIGQNPYITDNIFDGIFQHELSLTNDEGIMKKFYQTTFNIKKSMVRGKRTIQLDRAYQKSHYKNALSRKIRKSNEYRQIAVRYPYYKPRYAGPVMKKVQKKYAKKRTHIQKKRQTYSKKKSLKWK